MLPVLLLVPGQACTVLRVEGGAADLQIFQAAVGKILDKGGDKVDTFNYTFSN